MGLVVVVETLEESSHGLHARESQGVHGADRTRHLVRELTDVRPVVVHHEDLYGARPVGDERDPPAVRRPCRKAIARGVMGQIGLLTPLRRHAEHLPVVPEPLTSSRVPSGDRTGALTCVKVIRRWSSPVGVIE